VQLKDPFKGVELVRAWSDPVRGRHSLQLEVNKRLYMDTATLRKHAGFERLQAHLMSLLDGILAQFGPGAPATRPPPATPAP
jgi:N-formylglutamate amidohydrolase